MLISLWASLVVSIDNIGVSPNKDVWGTLEVLGVPCPGLHRASVVLPHTVVSLDLQFKNSLGLVRLC